MYIVYTFIPLGVVAMGGVTSSTPADCEGGGSFGGGGGGEGSLLGGGGGVGSLSGGGGRGGSLSGTGGGGGEGSRSGVGVLSGGVVVTIGTNVLLTSVGCSAAAGIPVLSPSHPYIPSFKSKDFSFTCLLSFFCCTLHITLRNILPGAIYCCLHTCCVYVVLSELCYVCTPTFIATIATMGQL